MRRFRAVTAILGLVGLFLPLGASAHVFATDVTIKALLHVYPDDSPVAGQIAGLSFSLIDAAGKFTVPACDCRVIIKEGSRTLVNRQTSPQETESGQELRVNYTFPDRAVYSVTLEGAPRVTNGFQPFQLNYNVRVDHGIPKPPASPLMTWGLIGLAGLAVLAAGNFIYREGWSLES